MSHVNMSVLQELLAAESEQLRESVHKCKDGDIVHNILLTAARLETASQLLTPAEPEEHEEEPQFRLPAIPGVAADRMAMEEAVARNGGGVKFKRRTMMGYEPSIEDELLEEELDG